MPLGMEVGLGPGDFVFYRDPVASIKRAQPHPIFGPVTVGVVEVGGVSHQQMLSGTGARVGWLGVVMGISAASTGGFLVLVMATRRK